MDGFCLSQDFQYFSSALADPEGGGGDVLESFSCDDFSESFREEIP
jgi:hypothetical protein